MGLAASWKGRGSMRMALLWSTRERRYLRLPPSSSLKGKWACLPTEYGSKTWDWSPPVTEGKALA